MIEATWNLPAEIYPSVELPKSVDITFRNGYSHWVKFSVGLCWTDVYGNPIYDSGGDIYGWFIEIPDYYSFNLLNDYPLGFYNNLPTIPSFIRPGVLPQQTGPTPIRLWGGEERFLRGPYNGNLPLCAGTYLGIYVAVEEPEVVGYILPLRSYVHYLGETPTPTPPSLIEQMMPLMVIGLMAAIVIPMVVRGK